MITHVENSKEYSNKLLELISELVLDNRPQGKYLVINYILYIVNKQFKNEISEFHL
jgi:hypothetical protein